MTKPRNTAGLDRDNNGDAGGSLPVSYPMICADTGAVLVVVSAAARDQHVAEGSARLATAQDLRIGGRADLLDLL